MSLPGVQQESLFAEIAFDDVGGDFRLIFDADRQRRAGDQRNKAAGNRIVGVEHREAIRAELLQQPRLRVAIIFQRVVEIEMIAAHVGNARGVEFDAGGARLSQRMAGNFHHGVRAIVGDHARQPIGQRRRGRRGHVARFDRDAVAVDDRASQPRAEPGGLQNAGNQPACACFAVGAGDADHFHRWLGLPASAWQIRPKAARLSGTMQTGTPAVGTYRSAKNRRCAALDRLRHVIVAIDMAAHQCHEQIAWRQVRESAVQACTTMSSAPKNSPPATIAVNERRVRKRNGVRHVARPPCPAGCSTGDEQAAVRISNRKAAVRGHPCRRADREMQSFGCECRADIASIRGDKLAARAIPNRGRIVAISASVSR